MKLDYVKKLAAALAVALAVTALPAAPAPEARAAAAPAFKTTRTNLYENGTAKGTYLYTVKNVKKGYTVKWSLGDAGAEYAELKYISRKVSGTTSSNKVTISTVGDLKAKNNKLDIVAKVYDTKGKLIKTLKDSVTLKIQATDISFKTNKIKDSMDALSVGKAYDFDKSFLPYNSTSVTHWVVTGSDGSDHSSEITSAGVWTPKKDGSYTITVYGRNSRNGKNICSATLKAVVGTALNSVEQTAVNQFKAVFTSDVSKKVTKDSFTIKESNGLATVLPKSVVFSSDGKTATVTTHTNFKNASSYTVTCNSSKKTFTASAGEVVRIAVLTSSVPANVATPIEYALYDENNIDVKAIAPGTVEFSANITNGILSEDNRLLLTTIGKGGTITATYKDGKKTFSTVATIICREAEASDIANNDFTITSNLTAPDFDAADYTAKTTISLGETGYAHFRATDSEGAPIAYSKLLYSSSDDNALIVEDNGKMTPIKEGKAVVIVRAFEGPVETNYTFTVTVQPKKKFSSLGLSTANVSMSNCGDASYKRYVEVIPYDQFGNKLSLTNSTVTVSNTSYLSLARYNAATGLVELTVPGGTPAGTYTVSVFVVSDNVSLSQNLYLTVVNVPSNTTATTSYALEFDTNNKDSNNKTADVSLKDGDPVGSKVVYARLATYRNGIFAGYIPFNSSMIMKDNKYYTTDLTSAPLSSVVTNTGGRELAISLTQIIGGGDNTIGTVEKAETGVYTVILTYNNQQYASSLRITDTENAPAVSIKSITSSVTATNALELVKNCLTVPEGYEITNCTAVGETATGDRIPVVSGSKLHISTVTLKHMITLKTLTGTEWKVYVPYTVTVAQTLTNK